MKTRVHVRTAEPQYSACFAEEQIVLGPMTGATYRWNPRRLGMMLARYKFVSKMFIGLERVAEIGCADAFASPVVGKEVGTLDLYDFDPVFAVNGVKEHNILNGPLPGVYDGIYMLDVLEHIDPRSEQIAIGNIVRSLKPNGVFIAGMPSLESQAYAAEISKAGHVNCQNGDELRENMKWYFSNVFLFGMNDEVLHTGFAPMCHYLLVLCTGPK